jgi:hypothetical protein
MNNDKINRLKEAYFEGKTSKEEEKWLKENTDDTYFTTLKEEQNQQMNWNFDDFVTTIEEKTPEKRIGVFSFRKTIYWIAAASVIIGVLGMFVVMQKNTINKSQYAQQQNVTKQPETKLTVEADDNTSPTQILVEEKLPEEKKVITQKPRKEAPNPITEQPTYNPEYVVINGKPIYDLEEAKELAMSSLNLLASNVEKSVSCMESIKHLSIKF